LVAVKLWVSARFAETIHGVVGLPHAIVPTSHARTGDDRWTDSKKVCFAMINDNEER